MNNIINTILPFDTKNAVKTWPPRCADNGIQDLLKVL
jgi:hypothetical protein